MIRYSEAVEFLYSSNLFSITSHFRQNLLLPYLPTLLLPQRIRQIRSLRIFWDMFPMVCLDYSSSQNVWLKSWDALRQMTGLSNLHIDIGVWSFLGFQEQWLEREVELFEPVKTITTPKTFVIILPNRVCSTGLDVGNSRCVFRLPEN